ncbi:MAG: hypothetical protein QM771_09020 [Nitrospira sp.]
MNATTTRALPLSGRTRQTAALSQHDACRCLRCGGFLVDERCMDIGESLGGYWFMAMRCVQCGDIIDEVILRNRSAQVATTTQQEVVRAA